ncbi:Isoleucine-tRNA ligase [Smittium culicis]|uniref:isoleucine--tRNA ligase n=1 Tax=Smittium culicis TaxID=133412 RepID=A0A1R1XLR1_9FUNG|nr:Isoleucine-tRNA ligase [Smittium culicis]
MLVTRFASLQFLKSFSKRVLLSALAESELEYDDNFVSKSAYVKFSANSSINKKFGIPDSSKVFFLIWTTTPWTLIANRAIAVNPDLDYTTIKTLDRNGQDEHYIVSKDLASSLLSLFENQPSISSNPSIKGIELVNHTYYQFFDKKEYSVLPAEYVTSVSGTGLVHTAPGHGKEDYEMCLSFGIAPFSPVDEYGNFTSEAPSELVGKNVLSDGNLSVLEILKENFSLVHQADFCHILSFPLFISLLTPYLYFILNLTRSTPQWFIDVSSEKDKILKSMDRIKFVPGSSKKRLEAFVKSRSQWCISRQRPWGTPIPVFYDSITDEPLMTEETVEYVIEKFENNGGSGSWWNLSTEELLHPKYLNNGRSYIKRYDTLDVWFDSGTSWTLISYMLSKDNKKFVSDVYLEGSDQHRGWFQSSLVLSCLINGSSPFKTLFTHGFFLDERGSKMSKSLGNVMFPSNIINGVKSDPVNYPGYGVDVLRLWVGMHDTSSDVSIGPQVISKVSLVLRKIRGTFKFLLGSLNDFNPSKIQEYDSLLTVDKFILHELAQTINSVEKSFDNYMFYQGMQTLTIFINTTLSSFYLDVIKDRLYADKKDSFSRLSAQTACHHILLSLAKAVAPITPHLSQEVFQFYKPNLSPPEEIFSIFQYSFNQCVCTIILHTLYAS